MIRNRLFYAAIPALMLAAAGTPAFAQATAKAAPESPPTMSETEEEAVFASALNAERRHRDRLAKLRRLRDIAREEGNQRRIHEIEQLMDNSHRRHERRIERLGELLDHKQRHALMDAVNEGRAEATDWAPRGPSVASESVRRHARNQLNDADKRTAEVRRSAPGPGGATVSHRSGTQHGVNKRPARTVPDDTQVQTRQDRRGRQDAGRNGAAASRRDRGDHRADKQDDRSNRGSGSAKRNDKRDRHAEKRRRLSRRVSDLRPSLRRHVEGLNSQFEADKDARSQISVATAEAEYQLLRQEIESDR